MALSGVSVIRISSIVTETAFSVAIRPHRTLHQSHRLRSPHATEDRRVAADDVPKNPALSNYQHWVLRNIFSGVVLFVAAEVSRNLALIISLRSIRTPQAADTRRSSIPLLYFFLCGNLLGYHLPVAMSDSNLLERARHQERVDEK
ncbi:unnamed protein product [Arctia plantaginis]|uniref:Uncharacterized protein n=1 Tax=Arctia plantaginis TaxID=874455 RepID=A0A8S0YR82_ARCPL|nr:unnamed protein product [Arctia plantaginis]